METNQKEEREYYSAYLPKSLVKKLQDAKSNYAIEKSIIDDFIGSEKHFMKIEMGQMDREVLEYKLYLIKIREALKEAHEDHSNKLNEFWEEISKDLPSFKKKTQEIVKELEPIKEEVEKIKILIDKTSTYSINNTLELVTKITEMSVEQKDMFKFLMENYKKIEK